MNRALAYSNFKEDFKKNFPKKLEHLLDAKHKELPKRKRRSTFYSKYDAEYPKENGKSIESIAKQWFSFNQSPTMNELVNICLLYDVDLEYFLTKQKDFNKDNLDISKELELSLESIDRLKAYDLSTSTMLNTLICCDCDLSSPDLLKNLLDAIYKYKLLASSQNTQIKISNKAYKYSLSELPQESSILKFESMQALDNCLGIDSEKIREIIDK